TPFDASGDANVKAFFEESGYDVRAIKGLRRGTGTGIATTSEADIRAAFAEVDGADVQALVHIGSNMPVMDICADLEKKLGKPVIGVNQATYWAALRENGIHDRLTGRGQLLAEF
ncbi:MAG: maleate cis-trans isomerase family protein, partial [Methyloligellaceae bacterium]